MNSAEDKRQALFRRADFAGKVRLADAVARQMVLESGCVPEGEQNDLTAHVFGLTGRDAPGVPDAALTAYGEALEAAYALGIAVGQLVSPEAFRDTTRRRMAGGR